MRKCRDCFSTPVMAPGGLGRTHQPVPHDWHQRHVFRWRARRFNAVRLPIRPRGTGSARPFVALRRYLLGVDHELLIADEFEGHRLLDLMFAFEPQPDDDSRALVDALMQTSFTYVRNFKAGQLCSVNLCYGLSRALIGDEQANALGFPNTRWKWLLPTVRPATWVIETARRFSTRVQALAKVAGPKAFGH